MAAQAITKRNGRRAFTSRRGALRVLGIVAAVAVVVGWALWLRPTGLGGPASYIFVSGESMEPTYHSGDLVVAHATSDYDVGDIIVYRVPEDEAGGGSLVIHRITGGDATEGFTTQGDNRDHADMWRPTPEDIVGEAWVVLPGVGPWLRVLRAPLVIATLAGFWVFLAIFLPERKESPPAATKRPVPPPPPPPRRLPPPPPPPPVGGEPMRVALTG